VAVEEWQGDVFFSIELCTQRKPFYGLKSPVSWSTLSVLDRARELLRSYEEQRERLGAKVSAGVRIASLAQSTASDRCDGKRRNWSRSRRMRSSLGACFATWISIA